MQTIYNDSTNEGIIALRKIAGRRENPDSRLTTNNYGRFFFLPTVETDEALDRMPAGAKSRLFSITGDLMSRGLLLANSDELAYDSFLSKLGLDPGSLPGEKIKKLNPVSVVATGLGSALSAFLSPYITPLAMIGSALTAPKEDENTEAQAAYEERLQAEATYGAVGGKKAKKYQKSKALARLTSPPPPRAALAASGSEGIAELLEELLYSEPEEMEYYPPESQAYYPPQPQAQQFYYPPQLQYQPQPQYVYQQQPFTTPTLGPEALTAGPQYVQPQAPDPFSQWGLGGGKKGKKGRFDGLILTDALHHGGAVSFASRLGRYMEDAYLGGWVTPLALVSDLIDNTRAKHDCGCLHDCDICNDNGAGFFSRPDPEKAKVGEFFRSSWIRASLVPMGEKNFGEVNVSSLPYEVKINSEAVDPRQELSLVHEGLHAASQTLKLPIDHQELHSLAAMILAEVIPSVTALRYYRGS